eukprot:CAMPEP_0202469742 /NCGR_PEP_ID=MMETSP1360-20130828/79360_1 /ASSEMBLY_ACC=CAM_ASM_000848 /TAXON_ID=515479 /ORGANISM="Licmophora paradoxa, Strain CCMP2313" /LENGTH=67 /DNA_ID=CAMNT_0049095175 /DNA_START=65 /DNA_END=268 /DNA_ORIENTATION=-
MTEVSRSDFGEDRFPHYVFRYGVCHVGILDESGYDGVDPNSVPGNLLGEGPGEGEDGTLGSGVIGLS